MNEGVCHGDAFLRAISILRGEKGTSLYYKMFEAVTRWNETHEGLISPLKDNFLLKEFRTLENIFEYMMSIIIFCQGYASKIIHIEKEDRKAQLELLTTRSEQVNLINEVKNEITSKEVFKKLLQELAINPNRIIDICVGDRSIHRYDHNVSIVVQDDVFHFIDSNSPYVIPPIKKDSELVNNVVDIIFSYFNKVREINFYQYTNELNIKNESAIDSLSRKGM